MYYIEYFDKYAYFEDYSNFAPVVLKYFVHEPLIIFIKFKFEQKLSGQVFVLLQMISIDPGNLFKFFKHRFEFVVNHLYIEKRF